MKSSISKYLSQSVLFLMGLAFSVEAHDFGEMQCAVADTNTDGVIHQVTIDSLNYENLRGMVLVKHGLGAIDGCPVAATEFRSLRSNAIIVRTLSAVKDEYCIYPTEFESIVCPK
jgi:hypothetical protein